jgi:hypothetical protein
MIVERRWYFKDYKQDSFRPCEALISSVEMSATRCLKRNLLTIFLGKLLTSNQNKPQTSMITTRLYGGRDVTYNGKQVSRHRGHLGGWFGLNLQVVAPQ